MRFLRYLCDDTAGTAVLTETGWRGRKDDGTSQSGSLSDLILTGGDTLAAAAKVLAASPVIDIATVRLLPPLAAPGKIICVGLNYADHTEESGYAQPSYPTLFPRFASSLIGAEAPIIRPVLSDTLDFEGELVAVIGKKGRHIPKAAALDHVVGYSIFNDASVREYQHKTPQWTVGKNFDGTGAFGPFFVTADELPPGAVGLKIETRLNGATVQASNTAKLIFDVATLIATISEAITLEPGDIIITGTPSGIGHARTPRLYMKPGDVVEVEIEGIGILRNTIEDEPARSQPKATVGEPA